MTGLAHDAQIVQKETFVPILYILKFKVSFSLSFVCMYVLPHNY